MKIKRTIEVEEELNIDGATLLSVKEAEKLPIRLRKYGKWWWLRSPGRISIAASIVYDYGVIGCVGGHVDYIFGYVRPALIISNIESLNLTIGDCFSFGGKEFEIVSNTIAFCKSDIGQCCFRHDYKSSDANIYEASDIKEFVDDWFRNAKEEE